MNALRNPQLMWVAGVAGVAVVGWILRSPLSHRAVVQGVVHAHPQPVYAPVPREATSTDTPRSLPKVEYTAESFRDPFISLLPTNQSGIVKVVTAGESGASSSAGQGLALPSIKIQGIIWGGVRPQAVIDGEVYDVGDMVQGTKIVQIDRTGVTGEVQGELVRWVPESSSRGTNH